MKTMTKIELIEKAVQMADSHALLSAEIVRLREGLRTNLALSRRLRLRCAAQGRLLVCYRIGTQPGSRVLDAIHDTEGCEEAFDALAARCEALLND